jgi:uncharacterized membrane protein
MTIGRPFQFNMRSMLVGTFVASVVCWAIASCRLLYEHYGDVMSGLIPVAWLFFMFLTTPMLAFAQTRRAWVVFWVSAMVLFSIRQTYLAARLKNLRREAVRIAEYADAHKKKLGAFPNDLSQYSYGDDSLRPFVDYDVYGKTFAIYFHPVSRNWGVTHLYSPEAGFWFEDD